MKNFLLITIVFFALSACSQYVCPTYSKQDVNKVIQDDNSENS